MVADDRVEERVKVVQQVHHLDRLTVGWNCSEANDVTEVNSDTVKILRFHRASQLQSLSHRPGAEERWKKTDITSALKVLLYIQLYTAGVCHQNAF